MVLPKFPFKLSVFISICTSGYTDFLGSENPRIIAVTNRNSVLRWIFPLEKSANCSTVWFWDWLLCFFPLRRLAEMENRNGSYLNDSISPNESMWEPLFVCLFVYLVLFRFANLLTHWLAGCVWTGSVFVSIGWLWYMSVTVTLLCIQAHIMRLFLFEWSYPTQI